jgi:hypothetical protein
VKEASQHLVDSIFQSINSHLYQLMTDNYGNFFISELIQQLQGHQRLQILEQLQGEQFIRMSLNNKGTYALQRIIDAVNQEREIKIIQETLSQG